MSGERDNSTEGDGISSIEVAALPWVFTQHQPLSTSEFIRKAKERGVRLDELMLRQLYKQRVLMPLVAVTATRRVEPQSPAQPEPRSGGTLLTELRAARRDGRLVDPAARPFLPRLPFAPPRSYVPGWWNGLLYSQHQLAIVPRLPDYLSKSRYSYRDKTFYPRLPEPDPFLRHWATWYHRIALMATALYYSRYFSLRERAAAQCGARFTAMVTCRHLLSSGAFQVARAARRVL